MGTTLQNGVYLPNEGERNCYAGLKTNWEILDQKVADVTALQQAVAGALHREIVESLPTTDIDPNTIYMVLSGTSATENVYNEYMYVNNAWELIGTSATDLTNYYTKAEVDGKLLLKASASDLTSHTGDTTIHVTTADKNRWNNQTYVFRYSSTALVASSTNSNALLDNTDNLKVGDKVIDSSGVLFSITAIDTQNSTFTIGTALIDLAQDSDVVHKSGDETVIGSKRFGVVQSFTGYPSIRLYSTDDDITVLPSSAQQRDIRFTDKNNAIIAYFIFQHRNDANEPARTCWRQVRLDGTDNYYSVNFNNLGEFYPENNNAINLGRNGNKWKSVYATNYYYGSNNVEFSTKFVTSDTTQTISGAKTFSDNITLQGTTTPVIKTISNIVQDTSAYNGSVSWVIRDKDNLNNILESVLYKYSSKSIDWQLKLTGIDNGVSNIKGIRFTLDTVNNVANFTPIGNNSTSLGNSSTKWKDIQTNLVNGLTPSSLGMPSGNLNDVIDISSYLVNLDGTANTYIAPANGWISITMSNCAGIQAYINGLWGHQIVRPSTGGVRFLMPILKNLTANILIFNGTIDNARFIPCQGNV